MYGAIDTIDTTGTTDTSQQSNATPCDGRVQHVHSSSIYRTGFHQSSSLVLDGLRDYIFAGVRVAVQRLTSTTNQRDWAWI